MDRRATTFRCGLSGWCDPQRGSFARWWFTTVSGSQLSPFFALKGQPDVSLGHSAATPQVAITPPAPSPERAAQWRGKCRPFRAGYPVVAKTQGGAARLRRYAVPWADMGLPFQGEEPWVEGVSVRVQRGHRGGPLMGECLADYF